MLRDLSPSRRHQGDILDQFTVLIENGILKPLVAMALPLEQAAQADRLIEAEHVQGKIVLTIPLNRILYRKKATDPFFSFTMEAS